MLFNSPVFLFAFLPITFLGYLVIQRHVPKLTTIWLTAASLFFYGWWDVSYVPLLCASALCNLAAGGLIAHARDGGRAGHAKALLAVAVAANLAAIGYFKYSGFLGENLYALFGRAWQRAPVELPLGISFFTFTQIAFLCDVYAGKVRDFNLFRYGLFVSYFPHLIAGPVLHHKEMMPQFDRQARRPRVHPANVAAGLSIFCIGLFKKAVLADGIADYANAGFDLATQGLALSFIQALPATLAYCLQIYFDFSGYSDMAIGGSLIFGVRLPLNFNSPYKSRSIIEFWRRWHMTLSRFLRDYLYFPLGGNRKGAPRRYANLMIVMLLGGLWHGAAWTFVIWGGLHGLYLLVNHLWNATVGARLGAAGRLRGAAAQLLTFAAVYVAWVFFRAPNLDAAMGMLEGLFGLHGLGAADLVVRPNFWHNLNVLGILGQPPPYVPGKVSAAAFVWLSALLAIVFLLPNSQELMSRFPPALERQTTLWPRSLLWVPNWAWGVVMMGLAAVSVAYGPANQQFLYFQF